MSLADMYHISAKLQQISNIPGTSSMDTLFMQSVHLSYRSVESSLGLIYSHSTRTHSSLKSAAGLQDAAYPVQSFTFT